MTGNGRKGSLGEFEKAERAQIPRARSTRAALPPTQTQTNSYQGLDRVPADLIDLLVTSYNPDVTDLDLAR